MIKHIWILLLFIMCSCVSLNQKAKEPPKITEDMSLKEAVQAGIDFGDETLKSVKRILKKREDFPKAKVVITDLIRSDYRSWDSSQLINAVNFYHFAQPKNPEEIFLLMVRRDDPLTQQLGWHIASSFPSAKMGKAIDQVLSDALQDDELKSLLTSKMADAIASNNLKTSYTLVREGLFQTDQVAFARAMIHLEPVRASADFMDYLAKAQPEELRQLNFSSVDIFVCTEILNHFLTYEVPSGHANFAYLFYYAISRNTAIAEMARKVLDAYMPKNLLYMATLLTRLPTWAQVAYIDSFSQKMSPTGRQFLTELKMVSAQKEIREEIDSVKN